MSKQQELICKDGTPYPFAGGPVDNGSKLNMVQQTAVDWMIDRLKQRGYLLDQDILQAKTMDKEQIEIAFDLGRDELGCKLNDIVTGEKYYNETYGTENSD